MSLASFGTSYATAQKAKHIQEEEVADTATFKKFAGIIISGMPSIYGLILTVMILSRLKMEDYSQSQGYHDFGAGLVVGLACLASGYALGKIKPQTDNFKTSIILDIFAEALGLYGLIAAILFSS
uniref:V-ATPase proteolipid subunit C-like domain-containing protein n=1 Tax=Arcella intermedia TaxID=1963864 RepID=A0A6B2LQT2_9EUKA